MNKEEFIEEVEKLGIVVDEEKMKLLDQFYHLIISWNEKINLTGIVAEKDVYLKHFYDSLTLLKEVPLDHDITLCDVGSGAGFPGIVLKIFFPNLHITLVDSLHKRVLYLEEVIRTLRLSSIDVVCSRMEDFSLQNEEKFDYITARAVAKVPVLAEISVRSLKVGGKIVLMKANCEEEVESFAPVSGKLGLSSPIVNRFFLPVEGSVRSLVSLTKTEKTSSKYPRSIDKIRKNPL